MEIETLNHTFIQLDTVLFHLIFRYTFSDLTQWYDDL